MHFGPSSLPTSELLVLGLLRQEFVSDAGDLLTPGRGDPFALLSVALPQVLDFSEPSLLPANGGLLDLSPGSRPYLLYICHSLQFNG